MDETIRRSYRSANTLVIVLIVLFALGMLSDLASMVVDLVECKMLQDQIRGIDPAEEGQRALALAQLGSMAVSLPLYIGTAIVFCCWIHRANSNAWSLGASDMTITPGWSVGWFFVPFANLFKPYKAVKETWNASDPDADEPTAEGVTSPIVTAWWGFWLLSNFSSQLGVRMTLAANAPDETLRANYVGILSSVFSLVLTVFAMLLVRGLHVRQEKLYRILRKQRKRRREELASGESPYQSAW